jgi:transposase
MRCYHTVLLAVRGGQPVERNYIGVDLHKAFFQACAVTSTGERLWEGRFARSGDGIVAFAAQQVRGARVAVEAMGPTWAFVDALQPLEVEVCVVDPRKTKLKAGFAAKTDRLDARRLADALRRDSVTTVYIPPPPVRDLRERCRGRHHLVRVRAKLVQVIRALLLRQDGGEPPVTCLYSPRGLTWLDTVALPGAAGTALQRLTQGLRHMDALARAAQSDVIAHAETDPIAQALTTMVGIGPILALTLRAEIGDITRFARWPQLASYAGLVPRVEASAGKVWRGRITREGSPWLRWALVEAAIHAMNRPDRTGRWARQLAVRKSVCPARTALARVLCRDIFRVWHAAEGRSVIV